MRGFFLLIMVVCSGFLGALGCLDADSESGVYSSPCSGSFHDILQCAGDTGGADPADVVTDNTAEPESRFTCADACQLFAQCGFLSQQDVPFCTSSCNEQGLPQTVLDCIRDAQCNALSTCEGL